MGDRRAGARSASIEQAARRGDGRGYAVSFPSFILLFLPATIAAYYATASHRIAREWTLLVASLVFYSWWDVRFLPVLLAQTTATWLAVELYRRTGRAGWLWAGVGANFASLI